MQISVKYFARYRELLECNEEVLELDESAGLQDLILTLAMRPGEWEKLFSETDKSMLLAVNHEVARLEQSLQEGDEVAIFPPVTGG